MNDEIIKVENLTYWHKGGRKRPVFADFSLTIQRGEFVVLSGVNGSGKSTLAKLVAGIIRPRRGNVIIDGINTKSIGSFSKLRQRISIVMQNPETNLLFDRVYDDIAFGMENLKIPRELHEERISEALTAVGMSGFEDNSTFELSGGQKQRIAIAGVLAMNCDCLVLDEPTSMLDTEGKVELYNLLWELNEAGKTIILSTNVASEKLRGRVIELGSKVVENNLSMPTGEEGAL